MDLQKPIVDHLCGELDIEKNKYYPMIRKKIIIKYQFCLGCVKYVTILIFRSLFQPIVGLVCK